MKVVTPKPFVAIRMLNPCELSFRAPSPQQSFDVSLARLKDAVDTEALNLNYAAGQVTANAQALVSSVNVMATTLRSTLEAAGKILAMSARADVQTAVAKALVDQLKNQAMSVANQAVNTAVASALNGVTSLAISELRRNLEPVYGALQQLSGVVGQLAMETSLTRFIFSARDCPAKAELLAEVYFRIKR